MKKKHIMGLKKLYNECSKTPKLPEINSNKLMPIDRSPCPWWEGTPLPKDKRQRLWPIIKKMNWNCKTMEEFYSKCTTEVLIAAKPMIEKMIKIIFTSSPIIEKLRKK